MKLSVVPDESERWNAWMGMLGSVTPAGCGVFTWFQLVILPAKMSAMSDAASTRLVIPGRL